MGTIDINKLKIGDYVIYNGKDSLRGFTAKKKYKIANFYDVRYGVILIDDSGESQQICNDLLKQYFYTNDMVEHPLHYTNGDIECIDAMIAAYGTEAVKNFCICNAFKYLWRFKHKNGEEDINKMLWYINKYKELNNEQR